MRQRLASLGFALPLEPVALSKGPFPLVEHGNLNKNLADVARASAEYTASTNTASNSPRPSNTVLIHDPITRIRPRKRARHAFGAAEQNIHALPYANDRTESRDMMPPPAKPLSRMRSFRKLIPTVRKKFSHGRASLALHGSSGDDRMHDTDRIESVGAPTTFMGGINRSSPESNNHALESPYMTGALPVGHPPRPTETPSTFTFRSPIQQAAQARNHLPSEPSYIRLMDDLSSDTNVDLQLQDPREASRVQYPHNRRYGQIFDGPMDIEQRNKVNESMRSSTHPTNGGESISRSSEYLQPYAAATSQIGSSNLQSRKSDYQAGFFPITPAPKHSQQSRSSVESVVSPFFRSSNRTSQAISRAGETEQRISSTHSGAFPYRNPHKLGKGDYTSYHESRGLNGLSFMNSPLNQRNERIEVDRVATHRNYVVPKQPYQTNNLSANGFIQRPEMSRSHLANEFENPSLYGTPYSRQVERPQVSASPFSSIDRPFTSRGTPPAFGISPVVSSHRSPVRSSRAPHSSLLSTGTRSARPSYGLTVGETHIAGPWRKTYNIASRSSVRR